MQTFAARPDLEILSGTPAQLLPRLVASVARYRHRVFVERMGWKLNSCEGLEFDEFDRPDTLYLAARRDDGTILGTGRLLPTDRPYLLGAVFPQLMGGLPLPRSPHIWELSRFAAIDPATTTARDSHAYSSPVAVALLEAALALAANSGARRLITVSPLGVERLLHRAGFRAHRAAPPQVIDGHALFACWIETGADERRAPPRAGT